MNLTSRPKIEEPKDKYFGFVPGIEYTIEYMIKQALDGTIPLYVNGVPMWIMSKEVLSTQPEPEEVQNLRKKSI